MNPVPWIDLGDICIALVHLWPLQLALQLHLNESESQILLWKRGTVFSETNAVVLHNVLADVISRS